MVIDSSIFIEHLRSKDKTNTKFANLQVNSPLYISTIILFEVYSGANSDSKKNELLDLLQDFIVLPFDFADAVKAGEILQELKKNRNQIEFRAILIAATAINHNLPLLIHNKNHFSRILDLKLA